MAKLGYRIFTKINRPSKELIEEFRNLPVANIDDNMGRIACVDTSIKPYNNEKLLGCAFTVKTAQGDNLMFHRALDLAKEGDVLVIAGMGNMDRSLCGEIMMNYAKMKKLGGFLIDGVIRDVESAKKIQFPVYAKGANPNGPYKNGPGEINVPVAIGGQVCFPGDIVCGDQDGVVFIRPDDALDLIEKVNKFNENEEVILANLEKGIGMDRKWIDKKLEEKGFENY